MTPSIKRIGIILIAVALLPALFFSLYELTSLTRNEAAVERIYEEQLDAVLFSVNQYANDVADNWAEGIDRAWGTSRAEAQWEMERLIQTYPALLSAGVYEFSENRVKVFSTRIDTISPERFENMILEVVHNDNGSIEKLCNYVVEGYRRIEGKNQEQYPQWQLLIFALSDTINTIGTFLIDPNIFANQVLGNRMQGIAREEFILGVLDSMNNQVVYATDSIAADQIQYQKPIWIFPKHILGIAFKGTTIRDLILDRFYLNLLLLFILNGVLIFAVWIVFKNIRKEIELAEVKADFVSNVSHEIRTPLSLISMFAETLEMGRVTSEEKRKEYYQIISQEARRLSGIVNKILHFSQTEANKRRYHFEEICVNEMVEEIAYAYQYHLEQKGFEFELELAPNMSKVWGDKEALSEATMNLLENAIKYSLDKKYICIGTDHNGKYVSVTVKDHGIGIGKEHQKVIFDKFYRVPHGTIHDTKGTGLGLSIVKRIIDAHKGKIELDSQLDMGSQFTMHLPKYIQVNDHT